MEFKVKFKRFLNRIYARLHGYFWLPCPNCGRYFGGHEIGRLGYPTETGTWRVCCLWCDDDNELEKRFLAFKESVMVMIIKEDIDKAIREDPLLIEMRVRLDSWKYKKKHIHGPD